MMRHVQRKYTRKLKSKSKVPDRPEDKPGWDVRSVWLVDAVFVSTYAIHKTLTSPRPDQAVRCQTCMMTAALAQTCLEQYLQTGILSLRRTLFKI